jgi:hypothetical protein
VERRVDNIWLWWFHVFNIFRVSSFEIDCTFTRLILYHKQRPGTPRRGRLSCTKMQY